MLLPLIVIGQLGAAMNAYFYLPWTITSSLQMVALNMSTSFTVEAARDHSQRYVYGARVLVHNLRILVPLVLAIVIAAPYLLGFFGAEYARQGTDMLRLLALSVIPYSFVSLYVGLERVQNRVHHIAVVQAVRCIALLSLSYYLLPLWGIVAAGVIWLAVESCVGGFLLVTRLRPLLRPQPVPEQKEQPA
jgi:O-antigen/teichoic acid export membrane protein